MPASDPFSGHQAGLDSPAGDGFAITPHNTNELAKVTRGIYVGGAGDVKLTTAAGTELTFVAVAAGTLLPIRARIVFATGTTATSIIGLV